MKCPQSAGSGVTDQEGELGYIPGLETSRVEKKNKNPSKAAQQMQRQKIPDKSG